MHVSQNADIFICEAYGYNYPEDHHMSIKTLLRNLPSLSAKRILLTHMSEEALACKDEIPLEVAEDGIVLIDD